MKGKLNIRAQEANLMKRKLLPGVIKKFINQVGASLKAQKAQNLTKKNAENPQMLGKCSAPLAENIRKQNCLEII